MPYPNRPDHSWTARQAASPSEETTLRALRIATRVQWRFLGGEFCTFTGGMREQDQLEHKGLPVHTRQTDYGSVLAIKPAQAEAWLAQRKTKHQR